MPVPSREIIRRLELAGWRLARVTGSHHRFKHPEKPGVVTVAHPQKVVTVAHPQKDVKIGTLRSIERRSGVRLRRD